MFHPTSSPIPNLAPSPRPSPIPSALDTPNATHLSPIRAEPADGLFSSGSPPLGSPPFILIVDDERNLRRILSQAMRAEGYAVETASNGEACLGFCQQRLPDLILMDAVMPEMDGFTCCEILQSRYGDRCPPILIITALADTPSVERAFAVKAVDYVTKPIHWAVLRQRVRRTLQTQATVQELRQARQEIWELRTSLGKLSRRIAQTIKASCRPLHR
ncbi:MAG: response regulator [Synechococcales bacterium]|nr:response regulator [Synechococcales bacterium]